MKSLKNIATTIATLITLATPMKADLFDGARPPAQYSVQVDARYGGKNRVVIPKVFGKHAYGFAATNLSAWEVR